MRIKLLSEIEPAERSALFQIALVALAVIALETVSFQALSFVNDYMTATQVLSVALLGIAVGGLLSYFVGRLEPDRTHGVLLFLLPLAVLATFPIVIRLNPSPILMMALMTAPYIVASLYISLAFNALRPNLVYLADLVGAGLGALLAVVIVPLLREEGSFFLLGAVASIPLLIHAAGLRGRRPILPYVVPAVAAGALALGLLVAHLSIDPFNMIFTARADEKEFAGKVFTTFYDKAGEPRWNLLYSRGSLIERIDIMRRKNTKGQWVSVYNGRIVDAITSEESRLGRLDNRMPTLLKLGQNPQTLLVGPSGQGLCKAIQALGKGRVDAVEINGAIAGLMRKEMYERSGYAYRGFDLTIGDVRTFLARTERKYDYITLLNTHRIWSMGHQGPPEYVHSYEAMRSYLEHLKPDGYVIFEERNINDRADLGIRRILGTAKAAMRSLGMEDPSKHIAVWELYHACDEKRWFSKPMRCDRRQLFTFVAIRRTPIPQADYEQLIDWGKKLGDRGPSKEGDYRGIVWRYLPQQPTDHYWTQVVRKDDLFDTPGTDRAIHNLSVVRDDVPFPFDVFHDREEPWRIFENTALLALVMVLLPAVATFAARRRREQQAAAPRSGGGLLNLALVLYFAILGLGYLLIEVVLIQWFGIFLSSPVVSLAIVLCTMLIASGLGGYFSRGIGKRRALLAIAAVVIIGALYWAVLTHVLGALMFLPFALRVAAAVALIAPLAFFMGMPFPYAMDVAKRELSESHAGLFFGINGGFAATATPLAVICAMSQGFAATMLVGAAAYLVCSALIALAPYADASAAPAEPASAPAPEPAPEPAAPPSAGA